MKTNEPNGQPQSQVAAPNSAAVPPHPGPLPPGEGTPADTSDTPTAAALTPSRSSVLPLPAGEGRGEGENFPSPTALPWRSALGWVLAGAASFHLAFLYAPLAFLVGVYLFALFRLSTLATPRRALWAGVAMGFLCFAPQLGFFYTIFSFSAVALWSVLAFWLGMYVLAQHLVWARFGSRAAAWLAPVLWLGFEFFRSELYYLRFTWLSAGYAFAEGENLPLLYWPGVYGAGALVMLAAAWGTLLSRRGALCWGTAWTVALATLCSVPIPSLSLKASAYSGPGPTRIAGIQIEHKHDLEVLEALKKLRATHPEAEVLVLSELAFDGPVPARVRKWCAQEKIFLVAGGKDPISEDGKVFYNSVFVISPEGEVVHRQAKTIPIQFMADGQPAPSQKPFPLPNSMTGFCICYDLSFTRVTDELIRQGSRLLIVPTADEIEWGAYEHRLHGRIAPTRAAEHRVALFRLASSGISQAVNRDGKVLASAPYPGELATLAMNERTLYPTRIPPDRWLGRISAVVAWGVFGWLALAAWRKPKVPPQPSTASNS